MYTIKVLHETVLVFISNVRASTLVTCFPVTKDFPNKNSKKFFEKLSNFPDTQIIYLSQFNWSLGGEIGKLIRFMSQFYIYCQEILSNVIFNETSWVQQ